MSEQLPIYFMPMEHFISRSADVLRLVNVTTFALRTMNGLEQLSSVLNYPQGGIARAADIEKQAKSEVASDFPLLHGMAVVVLWAALESAVRDFLIKWVEAKPELLAVPPLSKLSVKLGDYERYTGEDRYRYLIGLVERDLGSALQPGVGRFNGLLKAFSITFPLSDEHRKTLLEMASIRHVIAHRAAIADKRLLELCPWLPFKVGDKVAVGRKQITDYANAAGVYAASLVQAAQAMALSPTSVHEA